MVAYYFTFGDAKIRDLLRTETLIFYMVHDGHHRYYLLAQSQMVLFGCTTCRVQNVFKFLSVMNAMVKVVE